MKKTVLILHGWQLSGSKYEKLANLFDKKKYTVYALDLPGFGSEPLGKKELTLFDYVEFVKKFLVKHRVKSAIVIGHSFGGRVAVKLAYLHPELVEKLVLTGVPIIRHLTLQKKIVAWVARIGNSTLSFLPHFLQNNMKKVLYKLIGEYDYYKAGTLKPTLTNIVNEDLTQYAAKLSQDTLLVWGDKDSFTPKSDVQLIQNIIPRCDFIIIPGGHSVIYQDPKAFYKSLPEFI